MLYIHLAYSNFLFLCLFAADRCHIRNLELSKIEIKLFKIYHIKFNFKFKYVKHANKCLRHLKIFYDSQKIRIV